MAQQKEKLLRISGQDGMKICKMLNIDLEFLNPWLENLEENSDKEIKCRTSFFFYLPFILHVHKNFTRFCQNQSISFP